MLGTLSVLLHEVRRPERADASLLSSAASLAAIAIEQRQLAEQLALPGALRLSHESAEPALTRGEPAEGRLARRGKRRVRDPRVRRPRPLQARQRHVRTRGRRRAAARGRVPALERARRRGRSRAHGRRRILRAADRDARRVDGGPCSSAGAPSRRAEGSVRPARRGGVRRSQRRRERVPGRRARRRGASAARRRGDVRREGDSRETATGFSDPT